MSAHTVVPGGAETSTLAAVPIVVGRQAIHDRDGVVVAYELLYRTQATSRTSASALSGDEMTAEATLNAVEIGLDHVLEGRPAFLNADRGMLVGDVGLPLAPEQVVVEVLETVAVDEDVLAGCALLVERGYTLALDDFVGFDGDEPLLELAGIVKVDVTQTWGPDLDALVARCRRHDVRLLAEKVETAQEYELLHRLGFDLFQGYFLERPTVIVGSTLEPGSLTRLRTSALLLGGDLELEQVLELLHGDPSLAVRVMRLASTGRHGENRRKVSTIREAVLLAGSRAVQRWIAMMLLRPARPVSTDRFVEVLTRARAVELLTARHDPTARELGFTAGMLSALDLLLGVPPEQVRDSLDLDERLTEAAFGARDGSVPSRLRDLVDAATRFQLQGCADPTSPVPAADLDEAFAEAFAWTATTMAHLAEAA